MQGFKTRTRLNVTEDVQRKWLAILEKANTLIESDRELQDKAAAGMRLESRPLPPEVVGRNYASYCELVNEMYDAYLNNVQIQRAPYILDIIAVIMKRLYELRNELVHIIVNDYIYVDTSLRQLLITPFDIQIVVPYHFPLESRSENIENVLQRLCALERKGRKENPEKPKASASMSSKSSQSRRSSRFGSVVVKEDDEDSAPPPSVHKFIPEAYTHCVVIQRQERYRQWNMADVREKALARKTYFLQTNEPAPIAVRTRAGLLVQNTLREFMKLKRLKLRDYERDIKLGITSDPFRRGPSFFEENNKVYEKRRKLRIEIKKAYLKELKAKRTRVIYCKRDETIEDITDEIRDWFKDWYDNYNLYPQYPYDIEGGTLAVLRGDYPTIDEQKEADEIMMNETMGKTKEEIMAERKALKKEAAVKLEAEKLMKRKQHEALIKMRCDPFGDPGYQIQKSPNMQALIQALQAYRVTWSIYDKYPSEFSGDVIYGYMRPFMTEDIMKEMYFECRKFVDTLMKIDLKMLVKLHQYEFEKNGLTYPIVKTRRKPRGRPKPKVVKLNKKFFRNSECIFDMGIVTKPTVKLCDIYGDLNYAAYDFNIKDPNPTYPPPGYGDIKRRLMLSCILGCGIQPGATRKKAVMLLGPARNGKRFLAETVAGELNAVKIDITPEVFTAVAEKPLKALTQVFVLAKALQPAVIFLRNIERVFAKRVPVEEKILNAAVLKGALGKMVKSIQDDDKVIFIATCSDPWIARAKPMISIFNEILLVPRTDYGSLRQFFHHKFQRIRNMPRDYSVQALAYLCQGYGFSDIIDIYNEVMTPERIIRLSIQEFYPGEILQKFIEKYLEPLTIADYQKYVDFFIENSELKQDREDYDRINFVRADLYKKAEKKAKRQAQQNMRARATQTQLSLQDRMASSRSTQQNLI
ncbi:hypothetical protein PYW07_011407 [Mythimna separata]|uniref:ATPase AAA-type core domain-containing protein n=1 Tax=Mythimna separata TaxID=271217 RepID=A0AAD8DLY8_MYTSE|nr:hypothetical protein PYW07_011407 [Mythimna separata]